MKIECRRMTRVTRGDAMLLDSLDRSYLDTTKPFTASSAVQAILVTGTKRGRAFSVNINSKKLCTIFRKSPHYEVVGKKHEKASIFWRKL